MNGGRAWVAVAILALALTGLFLFPGHTYLQQDSQIWVPMLEHLWDPTVLERDFLATRPHLAFTIYDEVTLALRALGVAFDNSLPAQQLIFRALGIFGVWLLASAGGLPARLALLPAGVYALGATVNGPAVLTLEYEPTPRAFAHPLLLFSMGLAASGRFLAAGLTCGVAILYHPPTTLPVLFAFGLLALWPGWLAGWNERLRLWAPAAGAVLLLLILSRFQAGIREPQLLFGVIDPELEPLQRLRGAYNWVSLWKGSLFLHYLFLAAAAALALWRLRTRVPDRVCLLLGGVAAYGLASLALSYLLLEGMKWSLAPQVQLARGVAFVVLAASIVGTLAGIVAARERRWLEATVWLAIVYAIPMQPEILPLLVPIDPGPETFVRVALMLFCAGLAVWAVRAAAPRIRAAVLTAALFAPMLLMPTLGRVTNYPDLHKPDLYTLSAWARGNTPEDAMFLFAGFGRSLDSGIFRARALRAIYVDWKGGGQVNLLKEFGLEWWRRWTATRENQFAPEDLPGYYLLGIDYAVIPPGQRLADRPALYENATYLVYDTSQ